MQKLAGKIAVITGANMGLAFDTAALFVAEGAHVFITGRRRAQLDEAVQRIGRSVTGVLCDSTKLDDLDRLYEVVRQEKGRIDVLMASAAVTGYGRLGEITEEFFDTIFDLNVRGTLFTVQKALPLLAPDASVILVGSVSSVKGYPTNSVYGASKAALRAFARGWLVDLQDRRIRVNVLNLSPTDTPGIAKFGPQFKERVNALTPRGAMGQPKEIAAASLFLASPDSSFVNGVELFVDGGVGQV